MRLSCLPAVCLALVLAACGSATPGPGGAAPTTAPPTIALPTAVPPADGPVTGQGTVIEVPDGSPEVCLGPVRESYPPQCDGIPLTGWDWAVAGIQDEADLGGGRTRWGTYAVTGIFDGHVLAVTGSVPLALYDPAAQPSPRPVAPPDLSEDEWVAVESAVGRLPGVLTVVREAETGPVHVDVVHDDGSLQDWATATFGAGAVLVTSALR